MPRGASQQPAWAKGPLALIPTPVFLTKKHDMFTEGASYMCSVHNAVFRGYNSIYHQAPHVAEEDKADFVGYCLTWYKFVKRHADDEEANMFPYIEKLLSDDVFAETHKEHDAFLPPLTKFHEYLSSLPSPASFSGTHLREIMSKFQKPFEDHFRSEISTLAALAKHPNTPKRLSREEKTAASEMDTLGQQSILRSGITDVTVFFLFNIDQTYEDGLWAHWPEIPAPVWWSLTSVVGWRHAGWWKFSSCDGRGQPRTSLYASG